MSEVNVQIQNPQQTVNINNPSIVIEIPTDSIEVEITEQALEIQVQNPVIEVNIGGPCDCSGGGHTIEDEGTPLTQRDTLNFTGDGVTVTDSGGKTVVTIQGGGGTWGDITGTLSDQTDLQIALDGKVDKNAAITGATKTKITYDSKGLVTAGDDAAIADISGLQTALDSKAASAHTHSFADLTDGTFGGTRNATVATGADFNVRYSNTARAIGIEDGAGISLNAPVENYSISAYDDGIQLNTPAGAGNLGQVWTADGNGYGGWEDAAGGGSVEIIDITYADMETALGDSTLTPGQFYRITDAAGTDLGFICQAIRENEITVNGTGGYLNADFQGVGDYGNTPETFNAQLGIWRTSFEAVTIPYTNLSGGTFAVGDTITGGNTGATAVIVTDNGSSEMTAYMTSPGTAFDGSEQLDNGNGVTADMDGAAGSPSIVLGDVVIWNLLHYQLTDDTMLNGDNPEDNTDAYTLLDKANYPETYVETWDISEFDFANNAIKYRQDIRGNINRGNQDFQWGNDNCYGNTIAADAQISCINQLGALFSNTLESGGSIRDTVYISPNASLSECYVSAAAAIQNCNLLGDGSFNSTRLYNGALIENVTFLGSGNIYQCILNPGATISDLTLGGGTNLENNILENGASMTGITAGANCSISRNKIGQGATLGGDTILGDGSAVNNNTIGPDTQLLFECNIPFCEIEDNILENSAGIFNITAETFEITTTTILQGGSIQFINAVGGCAIKRCQINQTASIANVEMENGSELASIEIGKDLSFAEKTISEGVTLERIYFDVLLSETETIEENIIGKRAIPGFSDIPGTIDITGLTAIDFTAAWAQYRGIFYLTSSNATETIAADSLSNFPTLFPFRLIPASGLTLTLTGTAAASATNGSIVMSGATIVLDGTNGDFVELEADSTGTFVRVKNVQIYA